ncbi:MAG: hypothetical protein IJ424_06775 [Oscillospiraceae bacterium]|nr:hypothetical protein [Oscillospiraceae bacterium]
MRKLTAIIIALAFMISLIGCENRPNEQNKETKLNAEKEESVLNEEVVLPQAVEKLFNELSGTEFEVNEFYLSPETDQRFENEIINTYVLHLKNANCVYVFEFESEEDACEHAGYYNEDGSGYNSPNISMIIDYIAPVRMWQHGKCIIEYAHQDNRAYLPLCKIFGAPFVGKTDIMEIIETSDIQYIRTNRIAGEFANNTIVLIESAEELAEYYEANKETFDLERKEVVYSDTSIGFLDACDTYNDEWFENNNLLMVILSEGSGSVRHKITSVTVRNYDLISFNAEDFALQINVQRFAPEVQTCDMAEWHIMIGVPKRDLPEIMGLGMNETWDTDFGWMMEE